MTGLRIFFRDHAALAMLIVALALAVRAIVPAGYMTGSSSTGFTIEMCSGVAGKTVAIAIPTNPSKGEHGKARADAPCAFAALGLTADAAVDPIQLTIAIAFILAIGLRRDTPPTAGRPGRLRPPLRGPPVAA